ncbi:MAG: class I SAM-dependent methyltransferase [Acidobacteriota bacterium]
MTDESLTAYDEVWYPNAALSQTHPDRLATLANWFGLSPAPVEHCRVLELGCGDGGNLIPMAYGLPDSQFTGIDLAPQPIAKGQAMVKALGLLNITLEKMDILEVSPDFGVFDYIITHGIYSWVPETVREKILAICQANLADNGIAYISYNAYPGCHIRNMMREMLAFHLRDIDEPGEKIRQGRALARFLVEANPEPTAYAGVLAKQLEDINNRSDGAFYHDDLSEMNQPFYFYQFVADAARFGLQYLCEASIQDMQTQIFPPSIVATLAVLGKQSLIAKEQYLDFLKGKQFRQTLLCRQNVPINREPKPELLQTFFVTSSARPVSTHPNLKNQTVEEFLGNKGATMKTGHPLAKAAIFALSRSHPVALGFHDLLEKSLELLDVETNQRMAYVDALTHILLQSYEAGLVDLHTFQPRFTVEISDRPLASSLARWQITDGHTRITNLRHQSIKVADEKSQQLMLLLDGTHDHAALIRQLYKAKPDDETLANELVARLEEIAQLAFLIQ